MPQHSNARIDLIGLHSLCTHLREQNGDVNPRAQSLFPYSNQGRVRLYNNQNKYSFWHKPVFLKKSLQLVTKIIRPTDCRLKMPYLICK